uniref:Phytanoyl-CoA dioxygenase n=1 Tax=uncultured Armatimonadetes bacterium TaxID=157466 RepID=A0A6J4IIH1_9BACT|nr:Phytanoyl-CoA dioxygenase [uncultured Armatimonadetes bacterium]
MRLTEEQVRAFREDGVLVAEGVVADADLAPMIAEYEAWIDDRARALHAEGKIADLAEGADFGHRIARLYAQSKEIANGMDVMQLRGPATFAFLRNDNLLDAVECLVGPEITCNPIQHIRAKPPAESAGEGLGFYNVPWHQDMAVTWQEADDSEIVTCWLALVDATVENGCMEVLPGVWRRGYLPHQPGEGGTSVCPEALPADVKPRPVPVKKGGIVFMHRCTPHRSTPNYSDAARWSLDLRYQPAGTPTGRPFHPEFVARSRAHPETVLTDHAEWSRRWVEALESSKGIRAHRV